MNEALCRTVTTTNSKFRFDGQMLASNFSMELHNFTNTSSQPYKNGHLGFDMVTKFVVHVENISTRRRLQLNVRFYAINVRATDPHNNNTL